MDYIYTLLLVRVHGICSTHHGCSTYDIRFFLSCRALTRPLSIGTILLHSSSTSARFCSDEILPFERNHLRWLARHNRTQRTANDITVWRHYLWIFDRIKWIPPKHWSAMDRFAFIRCQCKTLNFSSISKWFDGIAHTNTHTHILLSWYQKQMNEKCTD